MTPAECCPSWAKGLQFVTRLRESLDLLDGAWLLARFQYGHALVGDEWRQEAASF